MNQCQKFVSRIQDKNFKREKGESIMIFEKKMYACKCDNCHREWIDDHTGYCAFEDKSRMAENVEDDYDWHTTNDDKHYCPNCYNFDKEDNLIIHPLVKNIG